MKSNSIGIDFGTTNSSIALAKSLREVELARFSRMGELTDAYRSLLYLERVKEGAVNTVKSWRRTGRNRALSFRGSQGRLMQSLKSFLSSRSLHGTEVFGRRYALEDLIARILKDLRKKSRASVWNRHPFGRRWAPSAIRWR